MMAGALSWIKFTSNNQLDKLEFVSLFLTIHIHEMVRLSSANLTVAIDTTSEPS